MKIHGSLLATLLMLFSSAVFGQNQVKIDSLKRLISVAKPDSNKVKWMLQCAKYEIYPYDKLKINSVIGHIRAAQKLADSIHYETGRMQASENLAFAYTAKLRIDSALTIYKNLLPAAEAAKNMALIMEIEWGIGACLTKKGQTQEGRNWLYKAIEKAKKLKKEKDELICLRFVASSYAIDEKYAEAIDTYTITLERFKKLNDFVNMADLGYLIAGSYQAIEEFEKALFWQNSAEKYSILAKDTTTMLNGYIQKADVFQKTGKLDSVEIYLYKSLQFGESRVDLGSLVNICYLFSTIYAQKNDLVSEEKWLKKYSDLQKTSLSNGFSPHVIDFQGMMGFFNLKTKKFKDARKNFETALVLAEPWQNWHSKAWIYDGLSQLSEREGNLKDALNFFKLHAAARDSLYNEDNTRKLTQVEMKYEFSRKQAIQKAAQDLEIAQRDAKSSQLKWLFGSLFLGFLSLCGLIFYNQKQRAEREQIRLELANLRSQMNPHFIFNCLNSIYKHIQTGDSATAGVYLQKFSKLLRLVLENSQYERISLKKDLEALTLYAEIEGLRFKDKLNFELKIDPECDTEFVKIPGLLLQPHVENAIWHGLMHRENGGKVTINIQQATENLLKISIEDNGIGREMAAELESKTSLSQKSLGREITENRLKISGKQSKNTSKTTTIDLFDPNGNPCGTRIELEIAV